LDKLRPRDKHRLQPEVRVRGLRRRPILLRQRSSQLRRDSRHLRRICHRVSNHRRQDSLELQDKLQPQGSLEHPVLRRVPQQLVQPVQPPPLPLVLLPLQPLHRNSQLDFSPVTG
jgi:hypothetical protein